MKLPVIPYTRLIFIAILLACQVYLLWRAHRYLRITSSYKSTRILVFTLFVLFNLPVFYLTFFRPPKVLFSPPVLWFGVYPFIVWQFSGFIISLLLIIGTILKLPFRGFTSLVKQIPSIGQRILDLQGDGRYQKFDRSRRLFMRTVFLGSSAYVIGGAAYGIFYRNAYDVVEKKLRFTNLPPSLSGLSLGLLSDIHSGAYMSKEEIDEYVRALNLLDPDIIFLPGDFVTIYLDEIYPVVESLSELRARHGIYACLGNHEFYSRAPDEITKRLEDAGIQVLRNDGITIEVGGEKLALLGIDDLRHGANFPAAMQTIDNTHFKILMTHKPYFFPQAVEANIDLTLAGHTHGGQVVFVKVGDFSLAPARFVSKFIAGLYKDGNSQMYVSRGVGTIGVPFRVNCPPEVTKLILTT